MARWKTVAVTLVMATGLLRAQAPAPPGASFPIDFSYAGYGGGGRAIPEVRATIAVAPADGDDGPRIQAAIDRVSGMPVDTDGFRGAVLLESGHFDVAGSIRIETNGVVLRGAGSGGPQETVLVATGLSRRALVMLIGRTAPSETPGSSLPILDARVPTGSQTVHVADSSGFHAGDRVVITRPSTRSWIARLGMDAFEGWRPENRLHWQAGSRDIAWHRRVAAIDGSTLRLDAPLTTMLDASDGGATIARYQAGGIDHVGLENLRLESTFDASHPGDEDHAWTGVALDRVENAWVRQATLQHFAGTAVDVRAGARSVTVEDVEVLDPIAEDANQRRRGFAIAGELTLVQRCRSRGGRNDFVTGFAAAGPNVFLDCASEDSTGPSGPMESWASGVLFDNVRIRGNALRLANRGPEDQGAGWSAANSLLWNCEATDVEASSPPDAPNAAVGCKGTLSGNGIVTDRRAVAFRDFFRGIAVEPRSLYLSQLEARLGAAAVERIKASTIERDGLKAVPYRDPSYRGLNYRDPDPASPLTIVDGRFMIGSTPAWTKRVGYSWFQGQTVPSLAPTFGPAITRFAPGRDGPGLTDNLETVVQSMPAGGVFYQHYGLWYDRRRVNHNYDGSAERRTADVWAPFMELPWARSGIGKAWDGLSRYDLTRFNPWYFERLKTFADLCDRNGRVLYYSFYFQHWLLESRAHYVDFPWRPVNARQDTGMPAEVPAADTFWDLSNSVRVDLHRRYIRKVLDTLGMNANVVFGLDPEYTGSLSFVRFWLDEIAAWQQAHGRRLIIALEIPKDEMDDVLEDPVRGSLISAINFHGWVYRPDGRLFAIRGGLDRSIREQRADIASIAEQQELLRRLDPAMANNPDFQNSPEFQTLFDRLWASTPALKARAIQEYRLRYPRLVILAGEPSP